MSIFLGIDIGTSGTRVLAVQETGRILTSATGSYPLSSPRPGWSEQDPADWWRATRESIQSVLAQGKFAPADVKGIGLSGQMHGSVFLNRQQQVIRPALLWNDQRTAAECEEIERHAGGRSALIQMVANPALTGFTAPKILWLRNHEPQNYEQLAQVLLPKDYIRFCLTGEYATEVSDASGTLLLDVKHRCWSRELLSRLEIDPALLPKVYESEEVSGVLRREIAQQLGLPAGIPVVGGGGDQAAGAIGNGIVSPGVISATMGTSGVVFAYSDQVQVDAQGRVHTFCHAVRGKWHVMGCVLSAGGSLQWYRNQLGQVEQATAAAMGIDPYEILSAEAAQAVPGCEGLYFLPYLTGERSPHADPEARGAWIGLTLRHGRSHLVRSVMEGATYAMRDCLEVIQEMQIPIGEIRLSGGGGRSEFWRQLQADIYGHSVVTINAEEGPAFGAALLAAAGTRTFKDVVEACQATIRAVSHTAPNESHVARYNACYPLYQKLYRSLKDDFAAIGALVRS